MKLTVSMATYDDYDGVYFTVQSLRLHQTLRKFDHEILVLDNNPSSSHGEQVRNLSKAIPEMRVIPVTDRQSSFIKYDVFKHATGDVVLGLDCHLLLEPGFISRLMEWWEANPESRDMLTGPLIYDDQNHCTTHMEPVWRGHDFGIWADSAKGLEGNKPFGVPMQGMGCFSASTAAFPILNPNFRGFGAEEWYVAEKVRQGGGEVLCHPEMGWLHRFEWPKRTFPLTVDDKLFNYYLGWLELYRTPLHPMIAGMTKHWREANIPEEQIAKAMQAATEALKLHRRCSSACGTSASPDQAGPV